MIETAASKSFAEGESASVSGEHRPREAHSHGGAPGNVGSAFTWLNVVCLDAPIVAVVWQWLFARSFGLGVSEGGSAALFLTAWLIYLADRFGDSISLRRGAPTSLRQRFCVRHRTPWIVAVIVIGAADVFVIRTTLEWHTLVSGAVLGSATGAYL